MTERQDRPTAILVVGMHRSGTSAATRLLNLLGVELGSRLLDEASDNSAGFWEHAEVVQIHERLLDALGRTWFDVRAMPHAWREHPAARQARTDLSQLLDRDFARASLWAVKDPRLCRLLPLWLDELEQRGIRPAILFVVRHPAEVANSLRARDGLSRGTTRLMWVQHLFESEEASRDFRRSLVTYDEMLLDTERVIARIGRELDISWPAPAAQVSAEIVRHLDQARRHHHAPAEPAQDLAGLAYAACVQGVVEPWRELQSLGKKYVEMLHTFGPVLEDLLETDTTPQRGPSEIVAHEDLARHVGSLEAVLGWGGGGSGMNATQLSSGLADPGGARISGTRGLNVDYCGVYYRRYDQSFSEDRCVRKWVLADDGPTRVEFHLPAGSDCDLIRFDPAESGGIFRIDTIVVDDIELRSDQFKLVSFHGHPLPHEDHVLSRFSAPFTDPFLEIDLRGVIAAQGESARRIAIVFERESIKSHIIQEMRAAMQRQSVEGEKAATQRAIELRTHIVAAVAASDSMVRELIEQKMDDAELRTELKAIRKAVDEAGRPWWQRWRRP